MTHKAVAGSMPEDPNALRPLMDGERHEICSFGLGEVLASLRLKTFRGSGVAGDALTLSIEDFDLLADGDIAELDLSTGTVYAERFDMLAMGVEPGSSNNPPARLFVQSNRDLTGTQTDAVVELEVGSVPIGA